TAKTKAEERLSFLSYSSSVFSVSSVPLWLILFDHRQRNHFRASTNDTVPHAARIASRADCAASDSPSFITPRKASLSAVSGSALMTGWNDSGKRSDEKNTPEKTYIG